MREKLRQLLIELRLAGMADVLDRELEEADKEGLTTTQVLWRLLCEEKAHGGSIYLSTGGSVFLSVQV